LPLGVAGAVLWALLVGAPVREGEPLALALGVRLAHTDTEAAEEGVGRAEAVLMRVLQAVVEKESVGVSEVEGQALELGLAVV
jgi:hypothetical protein